MFSNWIIRRQVRIFVFKSTSGRINLIKLSNYRNFSSRLYIGQEKSEKTFIGSITKFLIKYMCSIPYLAHSHFKRAVLKA